MSRRRNKLPTEPVEATIESLSHEGRGIAHIDGKTAFIDGALPGERVRFRYTRKRSRHDEGIVTEILEPSDKRVEPKCRHYDLCGGCTLQHMSLTEQIRHKEAVLIEQLKHIGKVEPGCILKPLTGPEWGYRRKARLGVKYVIKKEKLLVGFREKRTNYITDLTQCQVLHPDVGMRLEELQQLISDLSIYHQIPQIEIAVGSMTTAMIFRNLSEITTADHGKLSDFQNRTGIAIYLQPAGPDSVIPLDETTNTELSYQLHEHEITIRFSPDDFTQINYEINESMIDRVIDMLEPGPDENILDLFCGLGNFSLPIAKLSGMVVGIEASANAIMRARENAQANQIDNVEFHEHNLMQAELDSVCLHEKYQKILLDPPRSGAQEVIDYLDFSDVKKVVYVSCNPATLARDAGILVKRKGLKLAQAGVMDMFPHTSHIESIALFEHQ